MFSLAPISGADPTKGRPTSFPLSMAGLPAKGKKSGPSKGFFVILFLLQEEIFL